MNTGNYLRKVYLNADVYAVCLQHALSTEQEEIMGLLIGQVDEENRISHISSCLILRRSDKQPDRVEIPEEQLLEATNYAEQLAKDTKKPLRVVGWYHSHPHITVWPSRVDCGTQGVYQTMDRYFVGLIFSVFPNDTRKTDNYSKSNEIQLTCFQSQGDERVEIPVLVKPAAFSEHNFRMWAKLPQILLDEEKELSDNYLSDTKNVDPLNVFHNLAHNFNGKVHISANVTRPLYEAALARHKANTQRIKYLKECNAKLKAELVMMRQNTDIIMVFDD